MRPSVLRFVGGATAAAMIMSSSVAVAATTNRAAPSQLNSWQALAVLSGGASTIAYCGAAVAAQPAANCVLPQVDAPPVATTEAPIIDQPMPPALPGAGAPFGVSPLILVLGAVAVAALAYLLLKKDGNNEPNSPA